MKTNKKLLTIITGLLLSVNLSAQTPGTLTFSFTPLSHTSYSGSKNVLAVWIQTSTGTFVKTNSRYAGSGTKDHLPTWSVNAGGTSNNCLSASCNTVSATTGATLTSFASQTIIWDGTDVNGNIVADGTYQVTIQETWNHGSSGTATRSFTFQKGTSPDVQTPAADANFSSIDLAWNASSSAGIEDVSASDVKIYPNPSNDGLINVDFKQASSITVLNMLGIQVVSEQFDTATSGSKTIDLSDYTNGIYFFCVKDGSNERIYRVILNK